MSKIHGIVDWSFLEYIDMLMFGRWLACSVAWTNQAICLKYWKHWFNQSCLQSSEQNNNNIILDLCNLIRNDYNASWITTWCFYCVNFDVKGISSLTAIVKILRTKAHWSRTNIESIFEFTILNHEWLWIFIRFFWTTLTFTKTETKRPHTQATRQVTRQATMQTTKQSTKQPSNKKPKQ